MINTEEKEAKKKVTRKPPPPARTRRKGIVLKTPKDANRLINRLINRVLWDETPENIALLRVVSYSLSVFLKGCEIGVLAERIDHLEKTIGIDKARFN